MISEVPIINDTMTTTMQSGSLDIYMLTYNCGLSLIDIDAVSSALFSGLSTSTLPDLLVLSLQEIAPLHCSLIGGSFLVPYFERFHHAVEKAAQRFSGAADGSSIYESVAARNLGMTGIMVFAKDAAAIKDLEIGGVGVGVADMGNKGAIGVRFTYQANGSSTELTFVSAHLAAHEGQILRRNEDWKNIVRGMVFASKAQGNKRDATSLSGASQPLLSIQPRDASIFKPTSHLFFAGDLNYRTSKFSPAPNDHNETFPQPHHDESSPRHYYALYEHDQLNQERLAGRTLHGLTEAQVTFPPTYKYDNEEPFLTPDSELKKWQWAPHRWPSWCDRILYLDIPSWMKSSYPEVEITIRKYSALPLFPTSDHRAVALDFTVPLLPIPPPPKEEVGDDPRINPPFGVNLDWKTNRERARTLELVSGFATYFASTTEGFSVLAAIIAGMVGAYFAIVTILAY